MKSTLAKIQKLEQRLATEDFKTYKHDHPETKKTPSDPMFKPGYGDVKPHLSHEDMHKMAPRFHQQWQKDHQKHAMDASKKAGDARRAGDKVQAQHHSDIGHKHGQMALMHGMYAHARLGDEKSRPGALEAAKKRHSELSA